ncbi:MAG: SulP family inorganic anion transporter [Saprospiraceae bacterium]|nr:SulP family inorganic anion transporter [Saprospiraceae bacterium]
MQTEIAEKLLHRIFPFLNWWPEVNRSTLRADLIAGMTGAVIVLPQGVAFAMIAGMPPIYGLYTAMVIPIVAALFGSSKHVVSGPNTAISLVVFAAISQLGVEPGSEDFIAKALTITLMAGIIQLALGIGRMGTLINFVSHVVLVGFTSGAAILIVESQIKHFLGLEIPSGKSFIATLEAIGINLHLTNFYSLAVGIFTLFLAILSKKIMPKVPNLLIAIVGGSLLAFALGGEAVGIKMVGHVSGGLPHFSMPDFSFHALTELSQSAFAIALLGLIQTVAIARSISAKSGQVLDNNQEFIGQGLSNIIGSFFASYAGAGSFTRSALNYESGAKTALSAVFASLFLMGIVLLIAPLIAYMPIPAMAAVILMVAYNLIDFEFAKTVTRSSKRQTIVMAITFVATLVADLENAVFIGVIFSLIFYLQRSSTPNVAVMAPDPEDPKRRFIYLERKLLPECPQMKILRIDGSIFFGSVMHIAAEIRELVDDEASDVKNLLIIARGINFIDVAGSEWCVIEAHRWKQKGGGLYFAGLKLNAQDTLIRGGFRAEIGEDHFFVSKEEALTHIVPQLNGDICATCTKRIFKECAGMPGATEAAALQTAAQPA